MTSTLVAKRKDENVLCKEIRLKVEVHEHHILRGSLGFLQIPHTKSTNLLNLRTQTDGYIAPTQVLKKLLHM